MPVRIAVQTRMAEFVVCHCAACDQHPDPRYPEFGGMVDDEDFGHWWCEWCLSCGCHDGQGNGLPNCSTERFGFPDVAVFEPDGPPVKYEAGEGRA